MNRSKGLLKGSVGFLSVAAALAAAPMIASADEVVYQANKDASNTQTTPSSFFGDEIDLAVGPEVTITGFDFSYYVSSRFTPGAGKTITLSLHQMDGPVVSGRNAPGTVIDSWTFDIVKTASSSVDISIDTGALVVPQNLGWTITLAGLAGTEQVGLWAANTVVGSSLNDYWVNSGGTWGLATIANGTVPGTFAATVLAVPEPSVSQLGLIGVAFLFGSRFFRRK